MNEDQLAKAEGPPEQPLEEGAQGAAERVAELEGQLAERDRQLQRLAADFENFRRRAAADKEELISFAASRVLENFLPILDNFERALAHARSGDAGSILQGVELIYKQVEDFLTRHGVAAMEPAGQPFDPNLHEAIGSVATTEQPDHTVLAIAQKGYFLNGRVLRHAMVQVAENPSPAATDGHPTIDVHDTLAAKEPEADGPAPDGAKEESHE